MADILTQNGGTRPLSIAVDTRQGNCRREVPEIRQVVPGVRPTAGTVGGPCNPGEARPWLGNACGHTLAEALNAASPHQAEAEQREPNADRGRLSTEWHSTSTRAIGCAFG